MSEQHKTTYAVLSCLPRDVVMQVYAALQKYMRENGQHQGAQGQPQT